MTQQGAPAESARDDEDYSGVRVTLTAALAGARLPIQIDRLQTPLFSDAAEVAYPSLLDFPSPLLRAYPPETVVHGKARKRPSSAWQQPHEQDFDLRYRRDFEFDG